jgi:hypothetical protein
MISKKNYAIVVFCSTLGLASVLGCGSGGGSEDFSAHPSCSAGRVELAGMIGGMPATVSTQSGGGSLFNTGSPSTIDISFGMNLQGMLKLSWSGTLPNGSQVDATGSLTMPPDSALSGKSYCAGDGSRVLLEQNIAKFSLRGLGEGTCPGTAAGGEVKGCWRQF